MVIELFCGTVFVAIEIAIDVLELRRIVQEYRGCRGWGT